jgi:hypothetical protein
MHTLLGVPACSKVQLVQTKRLEGTPATGTDEKLATSETDGELT